MGLICGAQRKGAQIPLNKHTNTPNQRTIVPICGWRVSSPYSCLGRRGKGMWVYNSSPRGTTDSQVGRYSWDTIALLPLLALSWACPLDYPGLLYSSAPLPVCAGDKHGCKMCCLLHRTLHCTPLTSCVYPPASLSRYRRVVPFVVLQ